MHKKLIACLLASAMLLSSSALAAQIDIVDPEQGTSTSTGVVTEKPTTGVVAQIAAVPTTNVVTLDDAVVKPEGYNIENYNYFKLRDLAYLMTEKTSRFDVTYDHTNKAINMVTGKSYTVTGGELAGQGSSKESAVVSNLPVLCDGKTVQVAAYNIRGNTYYKLRDLGDVLGFTVDFNMETQTAILTTPLPPVDEPEEEDPKEPEEPEEPVNHQVDGVLTILIDVGHGGTDAGSDGIASQAFTNFRGEDIKVGDTVYEKDFNLPVALRLKTLLEDAGVTVYMTREDDSTRSPADRKAYIAKYADKLDLCLSVHHNAFNTQAAGAEVWAQIAYEDGGAGKSLANSLVSEYRALDRKLRGVKFGKSTTYPGEDSLYMLRYPAEYNVLGIISEYCFIDNAEDQVSVFGDDMLDEEAQAMANGILSFFETYEY